MSFMDFLFGGTKTVNTNTGEMDNMARSMFQNADPGLGAAGKMAKGYLKAVRQGNMTDLPSVGLAIARGATDWKELQRNLQMNTAMMPGEQSALTAGLLSKGRLQNQNQTGMNAMQGAANDISNFSNIFSQARQQRISATQQGQEMGLMGMQRGRSVQKTTGLLQGLGQLAGQVGSLAAGFSTPRGNPYANSDSPAAGAYGGGTDWDPLGR